MLAPKKLPLIIFGCLFFSSLGGLLYSKSISSVRQTENFDYGKILKIAACPTYYELTQKLDSEKYQVIPTASTAESIQLIKNNQADIMLAGRTLKPGEPEMENIVIDEGYSFLSNNEFSLYIDELISYNIYTDLNIELVKSNFPAGKINKVQDIYQYLNKGIIITSWENTDYTKAKIVHVFENNGQRVKLSRRPTIYCPNSCGQEASEIASLLK